MSKQNQEDSDFESCDSEETVSITQQIEDAIRELPTLEQKVQAIAINYYLLQKRELDEKKEHDIARKQFEIRNNFNAEIEEINAIVDGTTDLTQDDFQFMLNNKALFKEGQLDMLDKIIRGEQKLEQGQLNDYWLKCLQNSEIIAQQIQEPDREVLKCLYKIEAIKNEDNNKLVVTFFFKPNKWFHNEKISKTIEFDSKKEVASKSTGDEIEWKDGMNYTVTVKSKKVKKNKKVKKQQIIREPSFFHFFASISSREEDNEEIKDEDEWDDLMEDLEIQYELCVHIYEDLIPKSLQFYLNCQPSEQENLEQGNKVTTQPETGKQDLQEQDSEEQPLISGAK